MPRVRGRLAACTRRLAVRTAEKSRHACVGFRSMLAQLGLGGSSSASSPPPPPAAPPLLSASRLYERAVLPFVGRVRHGRPHTFSLLEVGSWPGLFSLATADASLLVNWMRDYLLLALFKFGAALKLHAMLSRLLHPGHALEQRRGIHCVNAAGAAVGSRKA